MEFPTHLLDPSNLRVVGFNHFYSNFNRQFCKQTVENLIRLRVLWRLIWVCTGCICLTKRTLGLFGLNKFSHLGGTGPMSKDNRVFLKN